MEIKGLIVYEHHGASIHLSSSQLFSSVILYLTVLYVADKGLMKLGAINPSLDKVIECNDSNVSAPRIEKALRCSEKWRLPFVRFLIECINSVEEIV